MRPGRDLDVFGDLGVPGHRPVVGPVPVRSAELDGDHGFVIDAAGTESSLTTAIAAIRPAGTFVVPAIYWTDVNVPGMALWLKETQLRVALFYGYHAGWRETDVAAEPPVRSKWSSTSADWGWRCRPRRTRSTPT
jgi:hypothetical protein